jgi:anthranilate/para-aminobenzoate synthase component II
MLIVIDNFDSFTYNLVQYFGELGESPVVFRNNAVDVATLLDLKPDHVARCLAGGSCGLPDPSTARRPS